MMAERFKNMTPEEREKFKAKWEERCGPGGHQWGDRRWEDKRSFFREPWEMLMSKIARRNQQNKTTTRWKYLYFQQTLPVPMR